MTVTKPSRFYFITTSDGENIQLIDQMNVGGYDLESFVGKTVDVTGVFTWNMTRFAIFPTEVVETEATAVAHVKAAGQTDGNVYTITGINLGKVDLSTLPAGLYIRDGKKHLVR